jgi:hypothetical protein
MVQYYTDIQVKIFTYYPYKNFFSKSHPSDTNVFRYNSPNSSGRILFLSLKGQSHEILMVILEYIQFNRYFLLGRLWFLHFFTW